MEWYDSGIGFAIPLEDINTVLPRLKEGQDLKRGMLGIMLQGQEGKRNGLASAAGVEFKYVHAQVELEGTTVRIDSHDYYIEHLDKVFGILLHLTRDNGPSNGTMQP